MEQVSIAPVAALSMYFSHTKRANKNKEYRRSSVIFAKAAEEKKA